MLGLHSLIRTSVVRVVARLTCIEFNSGDLRRGIIKSWSIKFMVGREFYSDSQYGKSPNTELFHGCLLQLVLRGERHTNKEPRLIYIMVLVASIHR